MEKNGIPGFDCAAARARWAADPETRMDLREMGDALSERGWAKEEDLMRLGADMWADYFRKLRAGPESALAHPRDLPEGDARRLRELLSKGHCKALHGARRRWPQVMALAGALDFGAGGRDVQKACVQAAQVGVAWVAKRGPDFFPVGHPYPLPTARSALIDAGRMSVCREVLAAFFEWAVELGLENPHGPVGEAARDVGARLRAVRPALLIGDPSDPAYRPPLRTGEQAAQALEAAAERAWLSWSADAPIAASSKSPLRI